MGHEIVNEAWSVESLKQFESAVADAFNGGAIRAPVHLSDGNESALIEIFRNVRADDYVFCSWRSHYQALLHGVPEGMVMDEIMAGRSISLCFPDFRFYSSAIVGGILPIAVGAGIGIKRSGGTEHVWCFIGDMTAEMGMAATAIKYSRNHELPVTFVIEDNGLSVCTDTYQAWRQANSSFEASRPSNVRYFKYSSSYPHAGAGVRVQF
jgi:TPP-dependent pyruvate/acetoin dehydrogenase alpha subunit